MAQCIKYPNECEGSVKCDKIDGNWYCYKHWGELEHLRATGRRPSKEDHIAKKLLHIEEKLEKEKKDKEEKDKENQGGGNN